MYIQPLKDWKLALFVALLIAIDVLILTSYDLASGLLGQLEASRSRNAEDFEETKGVSCYASLPVALFKHAILLGWM